MLGTLVTRQLVNVTVNIDISATVCPSGPQMTPLLPPSHTDNSLSPSPTKTIGSPTRKPPQPEAQGLCGCVLVWTADADVEILGGASELGQVICPPSTCNVQRRGWGGGADTPVNSAIRKEEVVSGIAQIRLGSPGGC